VKKYVAPDDAYCDCVEAKLKITGNTKTSSLFLVNIYTSNCLGMFKRGIRRTEEEKLLNAFEEEIIKKLRDCLNFKRRNDIMLINKSM
jgi:hypothetical protein